MPKVTLKFKDENHQKRPFDTVIVTAMFVWIISTALITIIERSTSTNVVLLAGALLAFVGSGLTFAVFLRLRHNREGRHFADTGIVLYMAAFPPVANWALHGLALNAGLLLATAAFFCVLLAVFAFIYVMSWLAVTFLLYLTTLS